jgi:D-alanyl-D-alanine dipeptidase
MPGVGSPIAVEALASHADFVPLSAIDGILVDVRYATTDNFTGQVLYPDAQSCSYLRAEAAAGLAKAATWLRQHAPELRLLVLDALRPGRVQELMWATLEPALRMYVADPVIGSIHSFGMAVDVTLVDAAGAELDLGSPFDSMTRLSHPELEAELLASGELRPQAFAHRKLLRGAMSAAGYIGIPTEWWHFNFGDQSEIRRTLPIVQ